MLRRSLGIVRVNYVFFEKLQLFFAINAIIDYVAYFRDNLPISFVLLKGQFFLFVLYYWKK